MPDVLAYLWVLALNFKYVCLIHNTQRTQGISEGPWPGAFKKEKSWKALVKSVYRGLNRKGSSGVGEQRIV